ncbi:DCC1-like thiol-disulfide oxidoreductase family protein [Thalassococcus sp. S3]|uniref:DCC1-like thiol-disulfide oxidoreductase family protein n=1 Tax=Thalassococcus sp. S3 TaxID=2017482 RepID=UPI0010240A65|nr:DCC1-like thiol-disulfide oxidoreductase family protein [Thalassococcus sp. S3]QBF33225.1 hypothetical protein CFI11_18635 [Thalassococcus sp. S3]
MTEPTRIIYDGECPFCARYVRMVRLRDAVGQVELIDARSHHPIISQIADAGLNLDDGMVVVMDGKLHHGDAAMTALAVMTTRSGLFNRLMRAMFANPRLARVLYPPLVAGRAIVLRLLGRRKING